MTDETGTTKQLFQQVRAEIETEDQAALRRARVWIGVRIALIVFVCGYMMWLMGAVSKMDAGSLTQLAAASVEQRIPLVRAELRDRALEMAPGLTDEAAAMLVDVPVRLREHLELQLISGTDQLVSRFETDLDAALTAVIDDQLELFGDASTDGGPEEQLDALVTEVSNSFRGTMIEALDELYVQYTGGVARLNAQLEHLLRDDDLTESEMIDRQLIEAWMVLVREHDLADPERIADSFELQF